jgi:hypothetical protein
VATRETTALGSPRSSQPKRAASSPKVAVTELDPPRRRDVTDWRQVPPRAA